MITEDKVTEIFCIADDFCKVFDAQMGKYTIKSNTKRRYHREFTMSKAEIMVIIIVELQKTIAIPLAIFIKKVLLGKCTGISFVDSTPLRVCRTQRIHIHKTFKGIAQRGKCSMGWFFGFKLHLICNEKGELLNFMITPGDIDDRKPLEYKAFVDFIYGKLVGDKGYISKNLFNRLFVDGIQLITKLKSNMKGSIMRISDRLLLGKRAIIETINDELKNIAQVEHSRHRSFDNFIVNTLGSLAAYCFFPKKPTIAV